jgi:ABC-type branched-subunit amino acid transport system permease subunit
MATDTDTTNKLKVFLPIGLLSFLLIPLIIRDEYILHVLIMILYFAYMASAWNIICGYVGQLSLGHSVFSGIGGYVSVLMFIHLGLTPWIGMLFGGLCAAVIGIIIGFPTFRLRGPYFALTTIAFAEILRIWFENTEEFLGIEIKGAMGLLVPLKGHSPAIFQFTTKQPYPLPDGEISARVLSQGHPWRPGCRRSTRHPSHSLYPDGHGAKCFSYGVGGQLLRAVLPVY